MPEGWVWCQLKDICSFLSRGKSPIYSNTIREYPVFAQKCNLKEGGISLDKALFLDPITLPRWPEQYKLQNEDILVNSTGTGTVGRTRLFSSNCLGNYPFVVPDSHVSVIRTWENISSKYVLAVLSSEYGQHYIEDNLAGSTNQKELYIGVLEEFPIPIAPSNEQQLIAEKIDSLFDAIFQIDRTKENLEADISAAKSRILDLAIHGKLVPQDHNDEPAIELLKRINPDFQPSDNLHYDGDLPSGWALCTLADVTDYGKCVSVPVSEIGDEEWVLELEDIEKNTGRVLCRVIKKNRSLKGIRHQFYKGQVLYSKLRTYLNKVFVADDYGFCTTEIIPITANECILPEYLNLILRSPYFLDYTASRDYGVKMPRLGTSDAKKAPIPVPPVSEQARIVNVVNEWLLSFDKVRDLLKFSE